MARSKLPAFRVVNQLIRKKCGFFQGFLRLRGHRPRDSRGRSASAASRCGAERHTVKPVRNRLPSTQTDIVHPLLQRAFPRAARRNPAGQTADLTRQSIDEERLLLLSLITCN
jgi:hypothetical protein